MIGKNVGGVAYKKTGCARQRSSMDLVWRGTVTVSGKSQLASENPSVRDRIAQVPPGNTGPGNGARLKFASMVVRGYV